MAKTSANFDGTRLLVYTSSYNSNFQYDWGDPRTDLRVDGIDLSSGMRPSVCRITQTYNPSDAGHLHSIANGAAQAVRLPNGEDDATMMPYNITPWQFVKVVSSGGVGSGSIAFLGVVTGFGYVRSSSGVGFEIEAQDYRVILNRIRCLGSVFRRPGQGDSVFVPNLGPHFGRDGYADMYRNASGDAQNIFTTQNYNRDDDGQADGGTEYADYWSCGDALNALRYLFFTNVPSRHTDVSAFMEWALASDVTDDEQWEFLFSGSAGKRQISDIDCCGQSLAWAIEKIVSTSGMHDWTLRYTGDTNNEKAELYVYKVLIDSDYQKNEDLQMGTVGNSVSNDLPDVLSCNLQYDWSDSFAVVRAVGAKRVVDTSLDFLDGESPDDYLQKGWSAAEESAWIGAIGTDEGNSRAYETVFRHYVLRDDFDWSSRFDDDNFDSGTDTFSPNFVEGPRRIFSGLASTGTAEDGFSRPLQMPMRVWRNPSSTPEELPDKASAVPIGDRTGVALSPNLRNENWNWESGPTAYELRATVSVETDQRAEAGASDAVESQWAPGELYIDAGPTYRYESRSNCYLPTSDGTTSGDIKFNATDAATFAAATGTHDTIRDDTDKLLDLCNRRLEQVARPMLRGSVVIGGLRPDIRPGYVIGSLLGDVPIVLRMAVRSVVHSEQAQTTTIGFENV